MVRDKSHGRDTRRVNNTPYALLPRCLEQRTRALDIRAIHLVGIAHPQPVVGRHVKYNFATGQRFLNRSRVAQVTHNSIGVQILNVAQIARRPHQQPQPGSLFRQDARNMTAQKSRGAGDESQHLALSFWLLALGRSIPVSESRQSCSRKRFS